MSDPFNCQLTLLCSRTRHEIKNGDHHTRFTGRAAGSAQQMHFLRFLKEGWGKFQNGMYVKGEETRAIMGRKY